MLKLFIFNGCLIAVIVGALVLCRKKVRTQRGKSALLLIAAVLTILCHYSSLLYHALGDGKVLEYLKSNPNLLLPIYPCNAVMWCCLIFGCLRKKDGVLGRFLTDYIFWFGVISCVGGMFANVDFIRNPNLLDYDVTKGTTAHAFMLFNVLLLPVLGYVKVDLPKNLLHIFISVIMMFLLGLYCHLTFTVLAGADAAWNVNAMFISHSPFDWVPFLRYPVIALGALIAYFGIFCLCELFAYEKGNRWLGRLKKKA